jgi:hypothetical protein
VSYGPIPRILDQTWKTGEIPDEWSECVASWRRFHPDWEYVLWTDESSRRFVAEHYREFLETFDAFTYAIQRADAIRYLVLHHFGGLYADLDVECLRPFDDLLRGHRFVIGREPERQARRYGRSDLVCNALMAAAPGHPLLDAVIEELGKRRADISFHHEVLASTGPLMIDDVWRRLGGDEVTVVEAHVFCPVASNSRELRTLAAGGRRAVALKQRLIARGSHAIHYWANSWNSNLAGELLNPEPENVAGYRFFSGLDSPGDDLCNRGRDIRALAAACDATPDALAFNTDGFLKHRVRPRWRWTLRENPAPNEGLYVREDHLRELGPLASRVVHVIRRLRQSRF